MLEDQMVLLIQIQTEYQLYMARVRAREQQGDEIRMQ
jgi:hypothetical protein